MENNKCGNRITDNALKADNGIAIIEQALIYVKDKHGYEPINNEALFNGVYYDSQKVGSHIIKVKNKNNKIAVLKLQLRPLPLDEGFIIRHINKYNSSKIIKTLEIIFDLPWNEDLDFGYLIFKDESRLKNLWEENITTEIDRKLHKMFLKEFLTNVLPIKPWLDTPTIRLNQAYKNAFKHFEEIADKSSHKHIDKNTINNYKKIYFKIIDKQEFEAPHFTHGHMSGKDIKYNPEKNEFILMANLYWSFRPQYYELTFPMWVDIMHIRNKNLKVKDVLNRIEQWGELWKKDIYNHNPLEKNQYWFNLLERAMLTIMLDLGASEWNEEEVKEKESLLNVWQELFNWIIKKKFSYIL